MRGAGTVHVEEEGWVSVSVWEGGERDECETPCFGVLRLGVGGVEEVSEEVALGGTRLVVGPVGGGEGDVHLLKATV